MHATRYRLYHLPGSAAENTRITRTRALYTMPMRSPPRGLASSGSRLVRRGGAGEGSCAGVCVCVCVCVCVLPSHLYHLTTFANDTRDISVYPPRTLNALFTRACCVVSLCVFGVCCWSGFGGFGDVCGDVLMV